MLKTNIPFKTSHYSSLAPDACIVCGNAICQESTDHTYINFTEFRQLALSARYAEPEIEQIKHKIGQFYKDLLKQIKQQLQQQHLTTKLTLNKLYYPHATTHLSILAQALENITTSLPNKSIYNCTVLLQQNQQKPETHIFDHHALEQFIGKWRARERELREFGGKEFGDFVRELGRIGGLWDGKEEGLTMASSRTSSSRLSETSSPTPSQPHQVHWKNLKIRPNFKTLSLPNKHLHDPQLLQTLPKLHTFRSLTQLDLRNNNLSYLSCTCISNYLPQLTTLDLRSNCVGDVGMGKLKNMRYLKQLMVDSNGIGDASAGYVLQGFEGLEVLWADANRITEVGAWMLVDKPVLKICSLLGNSVQNEHRVQIKNSFARKGLLYI